MGGTSDPSAKASGACEPNAHTHGDLREFAGLPEDDLLKSSYRLSLS